MKVRISLAYGNIKCMACGKGLTPFVFLRQANTGLNTILYLFPQTALRLHG